MQDKTKIMQGEEIAEQPDYGKFNTAGDLLAAYNALESEFTKRCQLIKQLQTELELARAQADAPASTDIQPDEGSAVEPVTVEKTQAGEQNVVPAAPECGMSVEQVLEYVAQNATDCAERLCAVPEIMDACIACYKQSLIASRHKCSPSGMAVIVPAKRPKSLSEAKRIADSMLSGS